MNKDSARNYMLLKSFRVYCINCVRDAEAVGSSPVASTKKASIERCSLFCREKDFKPTDSSPERSGYIEKRGSRGRGVRWSGGPVDHSEFEELRSTDRAGRRDRVPSPRLKYPLFMRFSEDT